ncbi:MAG: anti-sigma factor family protein [Myxococcota bacterium]|jgi:anti-sigma factor RsiW
MDMTCRELADFLMAYLDGELEDEESRVFAEHLEMCPPCKDYLVSYREAVKAGREVCQCENDAPEGAPEALVQAILAARGRR